MPHDLRGNVVEIGQTVTVEFVVTAVHAGDDYCNVSLETALPMFPGSAKMPLTLNTKQVEVVQSASWRKEKTA